MFDMSALSDGKPVGLLERNRAMASGGGAPSETEVQVANDSVFVALDDPPQMGRSI